jgi:hypothetical protein
VDGTPTRGGTPGKGWSMGTAIGEIPWKIFHRDGGTGASLAAAATAWDDEDRLLRERLHRRASMLVGAKRWARLTKCGQEGALKPQQNTERSTNRRGVRGCNCEAVPRHWVCGTWAAAAAAAAASGSGSVKCESDMIPKICVKMRTEIGSNSRRCAQATGPSNQKRTRRQNHNGLSGNKKLFVVGGSQVKRREQRERAFARDLGGLAGEI